MNAPDMTAAIEAGVQAVSRHQWEPEAPWTAHAVHAVSLSCGVCTADIPAIVTVALEAAVPMLLAQHREQIAREIEAARMHITLAKKTDRKLIHELLSMLHGFHVSLVRSSRPAADNGGAS